MPDYVVGLTTCNPKDARDLARKIVENRFCACVNILSPVVSIYHWKDTIEEDSEALLLMKTEASRVEHLREFLLQNHPYELPEFIVLKINGGFDRYLQWISESVAVEN